MIASVILTRHRIQALERIRLARGGQTLLLGAGTGMALGGWLGGFLFDVSGAYTWSIAAAILTTCLGIPLALALPRHRRKPPAAGPQAVVKPVPAVT